MCICEGSKKRGWGGGEQQRDGHRLMQAFYCSSPRSGVNQPFPAPAFAHCKML